MAKSLLTIKILADTRRTPTYLADVAEPVVMPPLGPTSVVFYDFDFSDVFNNYPDDTIDGILVEKDDGLLVGTGALVVSPAIGGDFTPPAPAETDTDTGIIRVWVWPDTTVAVLDTEYTVKCTIRTDGSTPSLEPRSIKILYAER